MDYLNKHVGFTKSFDNLPIYYEARGNGEPIIFVYGIACLINHWHHQLKCFSANYQTIAFDLRGHHQSTGEVSIENLSMDAIATDIEYLMKHLKIKKAHFVGHSFGAQVILKLFEKKPELIKSIVFINGFANNPIKNMFGLDVVEPFYQFVRSRYEEHSMLWDSLWKWTVTHPLAARLSALAGGFNLQLTSFKDVEIYARGVAAMELPIFMKLFEALMDYNGEVVLEKVNVPTLVISGESDKVTPLHYQEFMHDKIKNSEYLQVPYGSHCTQLDFPEFVNLRVEKFYHDHFKIKKGSV